MWLMIFMKSCYFDLIAWAILNGTIDNRKRKGARSGNLRQKRRLKIIP
jgi:hypothetical protein